MRGPDLLRLPGVERFMRLRYARLAFQLPLLLLALLAVYDGLTGRQVAPQNLATVSVLLHYRGLLVLALLAVGNVFCAACPLMLTRGATRTLRRFTPHWPWPRALRNKFLVLGLTAGFLFAYEYFDLWASPWLTAWLILGYFGAALAVDTFFPAGTFCKYVCPLGNFNFALSHVSPAQITARDPDVCRSCAGQYCVNGRLESAQGRGTLGGPSAPLLHLAPLGDARAFPGCETGLFVPQIRSNQDCTLCLNCVRACPHDNVALVLRPPTRALAGWRPRADVALLGTLAALRGSRQRPGDDPSIPRCRAVVGLAAGHPQRGPGAGGDAGGGPGGRQRAYPGPLRVGEPSRGTARARTGGRAPLGDGRLPARLRGLGGALQLSLPDRLGQPRAGLPAGPGASRPERRDSRLDAGSPGA
ncbi:4Fe-4S binding protein [Deinococcus budaensis]|uniref:Ferredoxin n=1 Tax=Deinococcus budaensis TaxID=1665626 RepID=A0A7W8GET5_9DEIO|nr:hypothetical protein [Deinococcus budaensis]MBB5234311.1 ferredoxin [Deinococcus budaensis]